MKKAMDRLSQHLLERPLQLRRMKEKGVKVIGHNVGDFVPEELIYAAGAVPVCQIHGGDPDSVEAAHSVITRFLCPFARAQIGYRWLKEQAYYHLVDMLIIAVSCQHLKKAADVWNAMTDVPVFRLGVPHENDTDAALAYFIDALGRAREKIETFVGNKVSDEKLAHAITVYNRMRKLLRNISYRRRSSASAISSLDFIKLNHASYLADPLVMIEVLESIWEEMQQKEPVPGNEMPKLLLMAPNVAMGDYRVLSLVEDAGGEIVFEQVCEGVRSYSKDVELDGADPMEALAVKYLRRDIPCAFMRNSMRARFDSTVELCKALQVDGIIWYQLKMCETYDIESRFFAQNLQEYDIPLLKLESEYEVSNQGQLKTRIEAFLETMEGR